MFGTHAGMNQPSEQRLKKALNQSPVRNLPTMDRRDVPDLGDASVNETPHDHHVRFDLLTIQVHCVLAVHHNQFVSSQRSRDGVDLEGATGQACNLPEERLTPRQTDIVTLNIRQDGIEIMKYDVFGENVSGSGDVACLVFIGVRCSKYLGQALLSQPDFPATVCQHCEVVAPGGAMQLLRF